MKDVTVVLSVFVTVGVCTCAHTDTHTHVHTYIHCTYILATVPHSLMILSFLCWGQSLCVKYCNIAVMLLPVATGSSRFVPVNPFSTVDFKFLVPLQKSKKQTDQSISPYSVMFQNRFHLIG